MSTAPNEWRPFQEPWQEVAKRAEPEPDMSPLSDDEREKLRRRLNAPGGWRLRLPFRERVECSRMGVIRWPEDIARIEAEARNDLRQAADVRACPQMAYEWGLKQYAEGILAALLWATGRLNEAPLSGRAITTPTEPEMWEEAGLGQEIGEGRRESARHRSYGIGVEATLLWLIARSDDPPI